MAKGNTKRAFWMKGRIFTFAKYKAWNRRILTTRVNPRNTSRECHRCHALIVRYAQGQPVSGYTPGTPLCLCPACHMRGNSDRNASLVIGQCLTARYQDPFKEKPHPADRRGGREEKSSGGVLSQDATSKSRPSTDCAWQGDGTAQGDTLWMDECPPLPLPNYGSSTSRGYAPHTQRPTTEGWKKPLGFIRSGVSPYKPLYCQRPHRETWGLVGIGLVHVARSPDADQPPGCSHPGAVSWEAKSRTLEWLFQFQALQSRC